jgi:4-hydroxy-tetrahydrodipicolinate synthase
MIDKVAYGVTAAIMTPRFKDESVDVKTLRVLIRFLMDRGVFSYAVNGATGEFCLTTPEQLTLALQVVDELSEGKAQVLCGVGAAGLAGTLKLVRIAEQAKVKALLLPMPYFFPYEQQDLETFCRTVAGNTSLPVLLYNLPQFTSGLDIDTVRRLIVEVPNIVGIKDSSGSMEILRDLKRHQMDASCIVGNDKIFAPAMAEKICDGIISGVACVLPEVISTLYAQREKTDSAEFAETAKLLDEFIVQLNLFPTPWALKWIAEARELFPARIALPVSEERKRASQQMMTWMRGWLPVALESFRRTNPSSER